MTNSAKLALLGLTFFARFAVAVERWSQDADVQAAAKEPVRFVESFVERSFQVDAYSAGASFLFAMRGDGTRPFVYRLSPSAPDRWQVVAHEPAPLRAGSGERRMAMLAQSDAPRNAADARRLLARMLTARGEWQNAQRELPTANGSDPEQAHAAWGRIAQELETVGEKFPEHLGIRFDLIAASTQLLAFERDTDRGHALCRLLPLRIRDLEHRAGTLVNPENDLLLRNRALWHFLTERYPLAKQSLDALGAESDTKAMTRALATIHQDLFDERPKIDLEVEKHRYEIAAFVTNRPSPEPRMQHHLRYFFPKPAGARDGRTWFTLTTQQLTDTPRYYLLGWEGNRAKVLRFFGTKPPNDDELTAEVRRLVAKALSDAPTEAGAP